MPLADIATLKHLSQQGMGENTLRALASEFGFCNGPGFVNPLSSLARHPFAGVVLLYGVGALAAT